MNPLFIKLLPYGVIVILLVSLAVVTDLYLQERDKLIKLTATVQTLGQVAEKAVEEKKQEGLINLETVKAKYEKELPFVRRDAVANYRMRNPTAGSCPVSGNGTSKSVDDGTQQEHILDEPFIAECATDASKVAAWQEYCTLNHCPIKD